VWDETEQGRGDIKMVCGWGGMIHHDGLSSWKEPLSKKNIGVLELLIIVIN
jgi:hypothetical protein